MNSFRYDTSGKWFKGNVHIHSTASDGGKTFPELAELYASAGYDFLFRTDHWVISDTQQDTEPSPLLWLDGIEIDGEDHTGAWFHAVCLGKVKDISHEDGFVAALEAVRKQNAIVILAHPHWCGNSSEDSLRWKFDGVEVYNHICRWFNGKGDGMIFWNAALKRDPNTLAFSVDDCHLGPGNPVWNGGWIVVNACECAEPEIMSSIRCGNFYSTCGPQLKSITFDGNELHLKTSPIQLARIVGSGPQGIRVGTFDQHPFTEVKMPVPKDWDYVYAEVEDETGRRACTNNLFVVDKS